MSAYSDARYALWLHLSDTHGFHSLESEMDEVIRLAVAVEEARKMEEAASGLTRPWVGKLQHARGLCDDWGCIRDESGKMVLYVNCGWVLEKDIHQHRKNGTDPTQPVVDYLLSVLNGSKASGSGTPGGGQ